MPEWSGAPRRLNGQAFAKVRDEGDDVPALDDNDECSGGVTGLQDQLTRFLRDPDASDFPVDRELTSIGALDMLSTLARTRLPITSASGTDTSV